MKKKKSQVSAEFLIILSAVLVIFFLVFHLSGKREDQISSLRTRNYAAAETEKLANGINSVYLAGDGSVKNLSLPSSLKDGTNYFINIYPNSRAVLLNYTFQGNEVHVTAGLATSLIAGNISGINSNVAIRNSNGVIYVEK